MIVNKEFQKLDGYDELIATFCDMTNYTKEDVESDPNGDLLWKNMYILLHNWSKNMLQQALGIEDDETFLNYFGSDYDEVDGHAVELYNKTHHQFSFFMDDGKLRLAHIPC